MGRPLGLAPVIGRLPAILTAYFGGPYQGGSDNYDALFGVINPGGKLPSTMPDRIKSILSKNDSKFDKNIFEDEWKKCYAGRFHFCNFC